MNLVTELQSNMEYSEKLGEKLRKQTTSHINEKRQARTPVTPVEEEVMIEDAENQNSGKDGKNSFHCKDISSRTAPATLVNDLFHLCKNINNHHLPRF